MAYKVGLEHQLIMSSHGSENCKKCKYTAYHTGEQSLDDIGRWHKTCYCNWIEAGTVCCRGGLVQLQNDWLNYWDNPRSGHWLAKIVLPTAQYYRQHTDRECAVQLQNFAHALFVASGSPISLSHSRSSNRHISSLHESAEESGRIEPLGDRDERIAARVTTWHTTHGAFANHKKCPTGAFVPHLHILFHNVHTNRGVGKNIKDVLSSDEFVGQLEVLVGYRPPKPELHLEYLQQKQGRRVLFDSLDGGLRRRDDSVEIGDQTEGASADEHSGGTAGGDPEEPSTPSPDDRSSDGGQDDFGRGTPSDEGSEEEEVHSDNSWDGQEESTPAARHQRGSRVGGGRRGVRRALELSEPDGQQPTKTRKHEHPRAHHQRQQGQKKSTGRPLRITTANRVTASSPKQGTSGFEQKAKEKHQNKERKATYYVKQIEELLFHPDNRAASLGQFRKFLNCSGIMTNTTDNLFTTWRMRAMHSQ